MRRKKDSLSEILSAVSLIAALSVYYYTKSTNTAFLTFFLLVFLIIGTMWINSFIKNERIRQSGIKEIDKMDGRQFEQKLMYLFRSQGYKVSTTPTSGDFGADLILERDSRRIVVQAKRYSKNVGVRAVQEVVGSLKHYKAQEAWVVTNRDYTTAAYKLAASNKVRMINRESLVKMLIGQ